MAERTDDCRPLHKMREGPNQVLVARTDERSGLLVLRGGEWLSIS